MRRLNSGIPRPRVLLDTNIWNYFALHSSAKELRTAAKLGGVSVLVAPSTLYEALRVKSTQERAARAKLITDPGWTRLMPEAYSESQELLAEVCRCHPEWLAEKGDRQFAGDRQFTQVLRHDWRRTKSGFWNRARRHPDLEAKRIAELGGERLEKARAETREARKHMKGQSWNWQEIPFNEIRTVLDPRTPGYSGAPVHPWRISAWDKMSSALSFPKHAYRQWLDGEFNVWAVIRDTETWARFWFEEVREDRMPRFWLRWAFEYQQMFMKVTPGTPGDAQFGTYLLEADFVLSADRNFIRMTDMMRPYSPCPIALTKLVKADAEAVEEAIAFIKCR